MRTCLLLVLFFSVCQFAISQCEFNNLDFNEWSDITEDVESAVGTAPTSPALQPDNWASLFRLTIFIVFGVDVSFTDQEVADNFLGVRQVDEFGDDYSICLEPDAIVQFADVIQIARCDDLYENMEVSIRYEGNGNDTLQIIYVQGDGDLSDLGFSVDPEVQNLKAAFIGTLAGGPAEWTRFTIDFTLFPENVDNPEKPDTALLWFIVEGDSMELATGVETKYFLDDVTFSGSATSFKSETINKVVQIGPNPVVDELNVKTPDIGQYNLSIANAFGQVIQEDRFVGDQHRMRTTFPPGTYYLTIQGGSIQETHTFIKLKE